MIRSGWIPGMLPAVVLLGAGSSSWAQQPEPSASETVAAPPAPETPDGSPQVEPALAPDPLPLASDVTLTVRPDATALQERWGLSQDDYQEYLAETSEQPVPLYDWIVERNAESDALMWCEIAFGAVAAGLIVGGAVSLADLPNSEEPFIAGMALLSAGGPLALVDLILLIVDSADVGSVDLQYPQRFTSADGPCDFATCDSVCVAIGLSGGECGPGREGCNCIAGLCTEAECRDNDPVCRCPSSDYCVWHPEDGRGSCTLEHTCTAVMCSANHPVCGCRAPARCVWDTVLQSGSCSDGADPDADADADADADGDGDA
jgi:hypothetical protein